MRLGFQSFIKLNAVFYIFATHGFGAPLSLKEKADPFYQGPSSEIGFSDTNGGGRSSDDLVFQGQYGWDNGISVQLILPLVVGETNPITPGNSTPRIGGGPTGRVEADSLIRLWGDTYDFFAFKAGVGFPWQNTTVTQNSSADSWLLVLGATGRLDWGWIALEGQFNDNPSFPAKYTTNGVKFFQDSTNAISASMTSYFYPNTWIAPFLGYAEFFPSAINVSADQGQGYFSLIQVPIGRVREVTFGSQFSPTKIPALFSVAFNLIPLTPVVNGTEYSFTGTVRWLF